MDFCRWPAGRAENQLIPITDRWISVDSGRCHLESHAWVVRKMAAVQRQVLRSFSEKSSSGLVVSDVNIMWRLCPLRPLWMLALCSALLLQMFTFPWVSSCRDCDCGQSCTLHSTELWELLSPLCNSYHLTHLLFELCSRQVLLWLTTVVHLLLPHCGSHSLEHSWGFSSSDVSQCRFISSAAKARITLVVITLGCFLQLRPVKAVSLWRCLDVGPFSQLRHSKRLVWRRRDCVLRVTGGWVTLHWVATQKFIVTISRQTRWPQSAKFSTCANLWATLLPCDDSCQPDSGVVSAFTSSHGSNTAFVVCSRSVRETPSVKCSPVFNSFKHIPECGPVVQTPFQYVWGELP